MSISVKEGKATYRPWGPKPLTRLSGLSFVFTGQFAKFSPKDVVETVEKLGGSVVSFSVYVSLLIVCQVCS
jgi:hypothetical protein